ncbi:hypothetical protein HUO13_31445 [Saccharopolyspora erythraea]|uniref:hypothetical protein n=1 Tax=Saccharopolyspora erythraea TaxID=1836 RepID=UPI001BAD85C3|nr:hypothetical protein [Saccharopolyspora erythraea]QUH04688.1 hypothetical protein HUO13_31445 [Saccharopolyspora erythraea]
MGDDLARELVSGVRGRRLCWELLQGQLSRTSAWTALRMGWSRPGDEDLLSELTAFVGDFDAHGIADRLLGVLEESVASARYWQEPDEIDQGLALPGMDGALLPVARQVTAAAPDWWSDDVAIDDQWIVDLRGSEPGAALDGGVAGKLAQWREHAVQWERRWEGYTSDLRVNLSGYWWSTPNQAVVELPSTTRKQPGGGPVGLSLVEDGMGWTSLHCAPVAVRGEARVFEVTCPRDWAELVSRYPMDVTASRRHDWWRTTGVDGRWLLPDYAAAGRDFDAVHLTTWGYLTTAGEAVEAGDAGTVLAGWNPDETYWLTDRLQVSGPTEHWTRDEAHESPWVRAAGVTG